MLDENKIRFQVFANVSKKREQCALLYVQNGKERMQTCENISYSDHSFEINPIDIITTSKLGDIIGVVHSHLIESPFPSELDKASCNSWAVPFHIYSVSSGQWHSFLPENKKIPLIGREYSHGVYDCYALVRDWFSDVRGIELPNYYREQEWWRTDKDLYMENFSKHGFYEVDKSNMRYGDVIVLKLGAPKYNHAAIYLHDGMILHHAIGRLSCREQFDGLWRKSDFIVLRRD
jgi:proteasome lid subunit RPN8/RPN11